MRGKGATARDREGTLNIHRDMRRCIRELRVSIEFMVRLVCRFLHLDVVQQPRYPCAP